MTDTVTNETLQQRKEFEAAMAADGWHAIPLADFEGTVAAWWHVACNDTTDEAAFDHWQQTASTPAPF